MDAITVPDAEGHDSRIYSVRGLAVMTDFDLAMVYGVETGALNRAVDRNVRRFPPEFAFRLEVEEWENLKCQIGIARSWGGRRVMPRVFSEHGAVMLAAVLNSDRAITASIRVVQAFVRLRHLLDANKALARRIDELAAKVDRHDKTIAVIFHELKKLVAGEPIPEEMPKGRIGFRPAKDKPENKGKVGKKPARAAGKTK